LSQLLKELTREEALNKRIDNGTIGVPPMLFAPELKHLPAYDDRVNGLVNDAGDDEALRCAERPWSDLEKCIFLDKFTQYPKNFAKIASFLTHKRTKDCVRFYYDSKKDVDYKAVLREHQQRRRGLKLCWTEAAVATACMGGVLSQDEDGTDVDFLLPPHERTFVSTDRHPPRLPPAADEDEHSELIEANLRGQKRWAPGSNKLPGKKARLTDGRSGAVSPRSQDGDLCVGGKKTVQKWTPKEKETFLRLFKSMGKDWGRLATLIPSKNESQIKNYYQNYKNRLGLETMHSSQPGDSPEPGEAASPVPTSSFSSGAVVSPRSTPVEGAGVPRAATAGKASERRMDGSGARRPEMPLREEGGMPVGTMCFGPSEWIDVPNDWRQSLGFSTMRSLAMGPNARSLGLGGTFVCPVRHLVAHAHFHLVLLINFDFRFYGDDSQIVCR